MVVETIKESLSVNKQIATKKEVIFVEGDMIVPDSKPDILNTICTSGVVCIYKKEVLDGKVRVDGNINTYIMYMAEDENDKVRGLNTTLDFSENIQIPNVTEDMNCKIDTKLKSIEAKVINGRKVGIKATIEISIKVYSNEVVAIVNSIPESDGIYTLKESLNVNSLVGEGENKIYAKDTINTNVEDNLAEILKAGVEIKNKDIKVSYNKILTKADANVKIMYLTEDNRIGKVDSNIPVVGFIDIPDVTEASICDVNYEIRNVVIKPNSQEEHSIYVEIEIGVFASVYEEKEISLIQDLYSPVENLEFNKRKITTIRDKRCNKDSLEIRETISLNDISGKSIIDVDVMPVIEKEHIKENKIIYEGEVELKFILTNDDLQVDIRNVNIPFDYSLDNIENGEDVVNSVEVMVKNSDFIVQDGGIINANIDLEMINSSYKTSNINVIDEIEKTGEREEEDYSIIMYIVKKGDTLWKIAKMFGSTVDDIARTNGIEDENLIMPGQKIFIPHYTKVPVSTNA